MSESRRLRQEAELTLQAAHHVTLVTDKQELLGWAQELRARADRLDQEAAEPRPVHDWSAFGALPDVAERVPLVRHASFRV